ncbi:hypothetical protein TIFTF001_020380 [Ficus carica]|uniref:Uncharacterized protein n=1 Tax=Ficus carica TaxID=3494 RepID=A0AA88A8H5_FICCA|nr:hypothetical protein TIFTF001_020380 [Ficus carica]
MPVSSSALPIFKQHATQEYLSPHLCYNDSQPLGNHPLRQFGPHPPTTTSPQPPATIPSDEPIHRGPPPT